MKGTARLKESAPAVLFYAGEKALLGQPGIAVVGSRHLDEAGQECARFVGNACGISGHVLYSGGAKGVDTISMERVAKHRKEELKRGDLCLVTPYSPNVGFSVGAAMGPQPTDLLPRRLRHRGRLRRRNGRHVGGRNRNFENSWVPVFVLEHAQMPAGNRLLLQKDAIPFPRPFKESTVKLPEWLKQQAESALSASAKPSSQPGLF